MYDPDTARTADIEMILSMAQMLVSGEEEAQAGLIKYQEQWLNDELDIECLRGYMHQLSAEGILSQDSFDDISTLVEQMQSRDYSVEPVEVQSAASIPGAEQSMDATATASL